MNGFSQLKLRKTTALLLFFLFGPILFLAVLGLVIYRNSGAGRADEEARLTQMFRVRATLRGTEFVRPGIQTYFGLTLCDIRTETPLLFCPEILARPLGSDRPLGTQVTRIFDELNVGQTELRSLADRGETDLPGREWLIPDLYLKVSQWRDTAPFFHGLARDFPAGGVLFRIGRVHLIPDDRLFEQIVSEYRRPRRRFGTDIIDELAAIGSGRMNTQRGEASSSDEVARYVENETESIVDDVLGIWFRAERDSFLLARLRFPGISATEPILLSLYQEGAPADAARQTPLLRWMLDTSSSPFPTRILGWFSPAMSGWGETGWMTGTICSFPVPGEFGSQRRQTLMKNVHFYQARLETLLKKLTSTRIEGNLVRLSVTDGNIIDGVFLGKGRILLSNAQFKKDFLVRFQKEFGLEFQPANTLVNRFPDDMVPFDRVIFDYTLSKEGIAVKAADSSSDGTAGVSRSTNPQYQFSLPVSEEKTVPYPLLLGTLAERGENRFWTSFYRDALNHLPVPEEE